MQNNFEIYSTIHTNMIQYVSLMGSYGLFSCKANMDAGAIQRNSFLRSQRLTRTKSNRCQGSWPISTLQNEMKIQLRLQITFKQVFSPNFSKKGGPSKASFGNYLRLRFEVTPPLTAIAKGASGTYDPTSFYHSTS